MKRPQVFIEKIMPVKLLNEQVYYEHGGNPFKGLHRWYSRKPLSFSRASVLASLLPADISMEEFEYLLGLHPEKDGILVKSKEAIKLYKTPPSSAVIEKLEEYCEKVWGKRKPVILDAFAGGGSIPFEAARYGLNVLASDLNPVAVVTMKAAMEYPLKFGADLQQDIDKWVKFVGDEAEKRLAEFFPSQTGETIQNYLWAHTVVCPHCESVVPLSPTWWLSKTSNYTGKGQERKVTSDWYAVKPIPNPKEKRVDFELIQGSKGEGKTIKTDYGEYDPSATNTVNRGVGKCPNCNSVIEDESIKSYSSANKFGHQLYAVAYKEEKFGLKFRLPQQIDLDGIKKAKKYLEERYTDFSIDNIIPTEPTSKGLHDSPRNYEYGLREYKDCFNTRQLLSLIIHIEIIKGLPKNKHFQKNSVDSKVNIV
jgi:putative DNA methylase